MSIVRSLVVAILIASAAACSSPAASEEDLGTVSAAKRTDPCAALLCPAGYHCVSKGRRLSCEGNPVCTAQLCGPAPLMPNYLCSDGVTVAGPGDCVWDA